MARQEMRWTFEELCAKVSRALSVGYEGQASGRVRDVPDPRTIRYYTTLGLIDRPAEMRGRTALYGRRHLLQAVAIKRLQARGFPLARVQEELLGLDPRALERLASLPAGLEPGREAVPAARGPAARTPPRASSAFWSEGLSRAVAGAPGEAEEREVVRERGAAPLTPLAPLQLVELREGVNLLFKIVRTASPEDVEAIRAAAAPLLELLEARRLWGGNDERNP